MKQRFEVLTGDDWRSDSLVSLNWSECPPPQGLVRPEQILVVTEQGRVQARCALWLRHTPLMNGSRPGLIGQYHTTGREASLALLRAARAVLRNQGASRVLGPMDGDTWHAHRWVTWSRGDAEFPMEPAQPEEWVGYWREAGFEPFAGYHSSIAKPDARPDPRTARLQERLNTLGLRIRPIDTHRFEEELAAIHELSLTSFKHNLLFQPLPKTDFIELYRPFREHFDAQVSAIAEDNSGVAGFLFCYPAPPSAPGQAPRLVIKTLAVRPGRAWAGLGVLLADHAYREASEAGYGAIIHALMQDDNISARIRDEAAEVFRRYTLFTSRVTP